MTTADATRLQAEISSERGELAAQHQTLAADLDAFEAFLGELAAN